MFKPPAVIIEDDPQLNQIFLIALRGQFEIETFSDGAAALTYLNQRVPALVVLDLHLPGILGAEILAKIRADARLAGTRVIMATADERQAEMLSDRADVVLLKPVSPSQLRELAMRLCAI